MLLARMIKTPAGMVGALLLGLAVAKLFDIRELRDYQEVRASISRIVKDCYIDGYRKKIVYKGTNIIAYMNCKKAKKVARRFHMSKDDIKKRLKIYYTYVSPVNHRTYRGSFVRKGYQVERLRLRRGKRIRIFAHKTIPGKSRVPSGNMFIVDDRT